MLKKKVKRFFIAVNAFNQTVAYRSSPKELNILYQVGTDNLGRLANCTTSVCPYTKTPQERGCPNQLNPNFKPYPIAVKVDKL
jgi:hypothetical protein